MSNDNRPQGEMTDDEYKRRYIERLTRRIRDEGMQDHATASDFAHCSWADCPRSEMMEQYAADPELAADESYEEWAALDDEDEREAIEDDYDGDEEDWDL